MSVYPPKRTLKVTVSILSLIRTMTLAICLKIHLEMGNRACSYTAPVALTLLQNDLILVDL